MIRPGLIASASSILILVLLSCPAVATARAAGQERPDLTSKAAGAIGNDARTGLAGSGIVVEGSTDKTTASLAFSWEGDRENEALTTDTWSFKVSTPLGDDEESADFVTDGGLPDVGSLEFGWSRQTTDEAVDTASPGEMIAAITAARSQCVRAGGPAEVCTSNAPLVLHDYMTPEQRALFVPDVSWISTRLLSFTGTVGGKSYKFRDPVTLGKDDSIETSFSLAIHYGVASQGGPHWMQGWYGGGGLEYGESYDDAKSRTLCAAPPPGGPTECFSGAFAAPERTRSSTVFLVARRLAPYRVNAHLSLGAQLKTAYDFETEVAGLEGTLYVIPGDGELRGGVRFKLQTEDNDPLTDDDEASIGLFVGKAF